jgi:hypothetical protein
MIKVVKNDNNIIHYECSCGTKGMCTVKPADDDAAIVIDVKCPHCSDTERMVVVQFSSEENRKKLVDNLNEQDLSWAPFFTEET